jgi:alkylation response protein AidB-like acyl-CoA dehydrogenase
VFDFDPGGDFDLIIETAHRFSDDALAPRDRQHEAARAISPGTVTAFRETGLAGLELPESLGGADLGSLARVIVNEELGAGDAGAAIALDPLGPALYPLLELGDDTLLADLVGPILENESARAVLVTEVDTALAIGDTVSGRVPWVPADRVDLLLLLHGDEMLAVRSGVEAIPLRGSGLRAAGALELRLVEAPIVGRWRDAAAAARALARARLYSAALLVGVMRQASEFSRSYAQERQAFGRPIAHHQGLAFLITDMVAAVDGARLLVQEAAWQIDRGDSCARTAVGAAASAYAEAIEAAVLIGPSSVQILGGHGFMQDYPVEKYMRECRALGLFWGGLDAARIDAGRAVCEGPPRVSLSRVEGSP